MNYKIFGSKTVDMAYAKEKLYRFYLAQRNQQL